jgi:hypothetical protein
LPQLLFGYVATCVGLQDPDRLDSPDTIISEPPKGVFRAVFSSIQPETLKEVGKILLHILEYEVASLSPAPPAQCVENQERLVDSTFLSLFPLPEPVECLKDFIPSHGALAEDEQLHFLGK